MECRKPATPHKFGINSPQSVKHISRKAFFKHALEEKGVNRNKIRIYGFAFRGKEVLIDGGCLNDYEDKRIDG